MAHTKPVVTIDLDEYNELLEAKKNSESKPISYDVISRCVNRALEQLSLGLDRSEFILEGVEVRAEKSFRDRMINFEFKKA